MKKIIAIHGDVTLVEVNEIPKGAKKIKWHPGFVLEKGEGIHTHTIKKECDIYEHEGTLYFTETEIDHEEHGLEVVKPAKEKKIKKEMERAFDYEEMESRQVID